MKLKITLLIALLLCVVLFTLQNTETVNIKFFLWDLTLSRALMIFLVFSVGTLLGLIMGSVQAKGKKGEAPAKKQETPPADRVD